MAGEKMKKVRTVEQKERNGRWFAVALMALSVTGVVYLSPAMKEEDKRPKISWQIHPDDYAELESDDAKKQVRRQLTSCGVLDEEINKLLASMGNEAKREAVLRELYEMLNCAERGNYKEFAEKYEDTCVHLAKMIEQHPVKGLENRIWNPFYKKLFAAICKLEIPTVEQGAPVGRFKTAIENAKAKAKSGIDKAKETGRSIN
jgi:hypothetical protein